MKQVLYWHFLRETGLPMSHVAQCRTFSPSSAALRNVNRLAHPDGGRVDAGCAQDFEKTVPTRQAGSACRDGAQGEREKCQPACVGVTTRCPNSLPQRAYTGGPNAPRLRSALLWLAGRR
jgi:hypothetical protein